MPHKGEVQGERREVPPSFGYVSIGTGNNERAIRGNIALQLTSYDTQSCNKTSYFTSKCSYFHEPKARENTLRVK